MLITDYALLEGPVHVHSPFAAGICHDNNAFLWCHVTDRSPATLGSSWRRQASRMTCSGSGHAGLRQDPPPATGDFLPHNSTPPAISPFTPPLHHLQSCPTHPSTTCRENYSRGYRAGRQGARPWEDNWKGGCVNKVTRLVPGWPLPVRLATKLRVRTQPEDQRKTGSKGVLSTIGKRQHLDRDVHALAANLAQKIGALVNPPRVPVVAGRASIALI